MDMMSLETLILAGNPIVNQYPYLAKIERSQENVKAALEQYFGYSSSGTGGISTGGTDQNLNNSTTVIE